MARILIVAFIGIATAADAQQPRIEQRVVAEGPEQYYWMQSRGFRSAHPGGVQFALADGSVHFLVENIETKTYRALSTRAGDESVSLQQ